MKTSRSQGHAILHMTLTKITLSERSQTTKGDVLCSFTYTKFKYSYKQS